MHAGKLVFAQLTSHLPLSTFRRCVAAYGGEHKVKVAGAIVSDQAGEQDGLQNAGAVEHVHDIMFRGAGSGGSGGGGIFDVRNHI